MPSWPGVFQFAFSWVLLFVILGLYLPRGLFQVFLILFSSFFIHSIFLVCYFRSDILLQNCFSFCIRLLVYPWTFSTDFWSISSNCFVRFIFCFLLLTFSFHWIFMYFSFFLSFFFRAFACYCSFFIFLRTLFSIQVLYFCSVSESLYQFYRWEVLLLHKLLMLFARIFL